MPPSHLGRKLVPQSVRGRLVGGRDLQRETIGLEFGSFYGGRNRCPIRLLAWPQSSPTTWSPRPEVGNNSSAARLVLNFSFTSYSQTRSAKRTAMFDAHKGPVLEEWTGEKVRSEN